MAAVAQTHGRVLHGRGRARQPCQGGVAAGGVPAGVPASGVPLLVTRNTHLDRRLGHPARRHAALVLDLRFRRHPTPGPVPEHRDRTVAGTRYADDRRVRERPGADLCRCRRGYRRIRFGRSAANPGIRRNRVADRSRLRLRHFQPPRVRFGFHLAQGLTSRRRSAVSGRQAPRHRVLRPGRPPLHAAPGPSRSAVAHRS